MSESSTVLTSPRGLLKIDANGTTPYITALGDIDLDLMGQITSLHMTELRYRDVVAVDLRGVISTDPSLFGFLQQLERGTNAVRIVGASKNLLRELTLDELDHTYPDAA